MSALSTISRGFIRSLYSYRSLNRFDRETRRYYVKHLRLIFVFVERLKTNYFVTIHVLRNYLFFIQSRREIRHSTIRIHIYIYNKYNVTAPDVSISEPRKRTEKSFNIETVIASRVNEKKRKQKKKLGRTFWHD